MTMSEEQFLGVFDDLLAHAASMADGQHPAIGADERWEAGYVAGRATLARELQSLLRQWRPQTGISDAEVTGGLKLATSLSADDRDTLVFHLRRAGMIGHSHAVDDIGAQQLAHDLQSVIDDQQLSPVDCEHIAQVLGSKGLLTPRPTGR